MTIQHELFPRYSVLLLIWLIGSLHSIADDTSNNLSHTLGPHDIVFSEDSFLVNSQKGKTLLVLFFDHENTLHKRSIIYSRVLWEKYKKQGLTVIGVPGKYAKSKLFRQNADLMFPWLIDKDKCVHKKFNIGDCCGGIIFVNKKGKIIFKDNKLMDPESLRQLLELELPGNINYDFARPEEQRFFEMNHKPRSLDLIVPYSRKNRKISDLPEKNVVLTFFSTVCSVCKSGNRVKTLIKVQQHYENKLAGRAGFYLIFTHAYEESDLEMWERKMPMPFRKFFGRDIFTDEEKYITDDNLKCDPLTVILDKDKRVIFIEKPGLTEDEVYFELIHTIVNQMTH